MTDAPPVTEPAVPEDLYGSRDIAAMVYGDRSHWERVEQIADQLGVECRGRVADERLFPFGFLFLVIDAWYIDKTRSLIDGMVRLRKQTVSMHDQRHDDYLFGARTRDERSLLF